MHRHLARLHGSSSLTGVRLPRRPVAGSGAGGGSKLAGAASLVVREAAVLSAIGCAVFTTVALAGFAGAQWAEAREDAAALPLGRRVALKSGRRFHVRDTRDDPRGDLVPPPDAAAGAPITVVFESGQGETLLEWEQVVQELAHIDPTLR